MYKRQVHSSNRNCERRKLYGRAGWALHQRHDPGGHLFDHRIPWRGQRHQSDHRRGGGEPPGLFAVQCVSGEGVHGRYGIFGTGGLCGLQRVHAADATVHRADRLYLSDRGIIGDHPGHLF